MLRPFALVIVAMGWAEPLWAGRIPVDFTRGSFVNPDPNSVVSGFDNCSSTGRFVSKRKRLDITLDRLVGMPDTDQVPCSGDEVICFITNVVGLREIYPRTLSTTVILRGEVLRNRVEIHADLCKDSDPSIQGLVCLPREGSAYGVDAVCHRADATYQPLLVFPFAGPNSCSGVNSVVETPAPSSPILVRLGHSSDCP